MTLETDLTLEQVRQIAAERNYPHPVAELIRDHLGELQHAARTQTLNETTPEVFFSLARQLERLVPFPLAAVDMVGIWADIMAVEDKQVERRQTDPLFGQVITIAHVAKPVTDSNWQHIPTLWLEERALPASHETELLLVRQQLDLLRRELNIIDALKPKPLNKAAQAALVAGLSQGSEEDQMKVLTLINSSVFRADPILIALSHGWVMESRR